MDLDGVLGTGGDTVPAADAELSGLFRELHGCFAGSEKPRGADHPAQPTQGAFFDIDIAIHITPVTGDS